MTELAAQLEAVVFDMDGVLVDTEPVHLGVARALVALVNRRVAGLNGCVF